MNPNTSQSPIFDVVIIYFTFIYAMNGRSVCSHIIIIMSYVYSIYIDSNEQHGCHASHLACVPSGTRALHEISHT